MIGPRRLRGFGLLCLAALIGGACGGPLGGQGAAPRADPNVRGGYGGEFWWAVDEPASPLAAIDSDDATALVESVHAAIEPERDELFPVSLVATFPTAADAQAHRAIVRDLLAASADWYEEAAHEAARDARDDPDEVAPLTPPERAALKERNLAPGDRGIGWGGAAESVDAAVYAMGPVLVVSGLEALSWDEVDDLHPLAHLLAASGAEVLLEGDRGGEGSIIADVSCALADSASGGAILDELGDAILTGGQFHARPPWMGPPLTDAERLARATFRRYTQGMQAATVGDESAWSEFAARYLAAGSDEERLRVSEEIGVRMRERGLALMDGEVDPGVLALILDVGMSTDIDAIRTWSVKVGSTMGPLPLVETEHGLAPTPDDYANLVHTGSLRVGDGRLDIGWLGFGRFGIAMPRLAGYLTDRGCTDLRVGLVDFDTVRGD